VDWSPVGIALVALLQTVALWLIVRVERYVRSDMKDDITHRKVVFTSPTPRNEGKTSIAANVRHAGRSFDASDVDADELAWFLLKVVGHGDCACFTLTSDGGALSITVIQGDTRHKAYAKDSEELIERCHDLLDELY